MSPARPRAYLDTNVFIAAFESPGARSDHAWWILNAIERGEIEGATSEITLAELLVKPIEQGATALASAYNAMLVSGANFEVMPVQRNILIEAAGLRAQRISIKLPDAVHIASALALNCAVFISGDRRLKIPDGLTLIEVGPFTVDDMLKAQE